MIKIKLTADMFGCQYIKYQKDIFAIIPSDKKHDFLREFNEAVISIVNKYKHRVEVKL